MYYILDDNNNPVPVTDVLEWGHFLSKGKRIVSQDTVGLRFVSTVFLGLDHRWLPVPVDRPLLWETMIFDKGKSGDHLCWRHTTYQNAKEAHKLACKAALLSHFLPWSIVKKLIKPQAKWQV